MKFIHDKFPASRPRRLRRNPMIRSLVRETRLHASDLIWPIFICEDNRSGQEIPSMPGVSRHSITDAITMAREAAAIGIKCVALFPQIDRSFKTPDCSHAWHPNNLANQAARAIKKACPDILVMMDVALDPYNSDGHDGILNHGYVDNDETLKCLKKQALSHAEAGADILGPSDMMDGRIAAIRAELDQVGLVDTMILSYSAKFASSLYGPFRDAIGSAEMLVGDKKTYQLDYANANEALRMVERDLGEGADMVMVKPGMLYLDICRIVKDRFKVPTFAYQVSGEYSMIMSGAITGSIDRNRTIIESLTAFKRAGCDGILTYFAMAAARLLSD